MGKSSSVVEKTTGQSSAFLNMAFDMGWRLAAVVLIPVVGGVQLDKAFDTEPILLIIGFMLAAVGTMGVMWRAMKQASAFNDKDKNV